jgi:hypothetical protein
VVVDLLYSVKFKRGVVDGLANSGVGGAERVGPARKFDFTSALFAYLLLPSHCSDAMY